MDPIAPVPLPRTGVGAKKDALSSSLTDLSSTAKLPPTPAKRPIPLPRLKGVARGERNIFSTLTRRPSNASSVSNPSTVEEPVAMGDTLNEIQDLFRSITFPSPLKEEELKWSIKPVESEKSVNEVDAIIVDNGGDREMTPSPEPPFYPPPPLPDESVYDEVQSLPGSTSGPWFSVVPRPHSERNYGKRSQGGEEESPEETYAGSNQSASYYPCSFSSWTDSPTDTEEGIYEDVAIGSPSSGGGGSSHTGDYSSGSEGLCLTPKKLSVLSCDSWSFYDAVERVSEPEKSVGEEGNSSERAGRVKLLSASEHLPEEYENVVIVTPRSTVTSDCSDPFIFNPESSPRVSSKTPEPPAPLTPVRPPFPDRMPLLIPSPSPVPTSPTWPSEKSQSPACPGQVTKVDIPVPVRAKLDIRTSPSRRVTPSLILEFDPLFSESGCGQQSHSSPQLANIFDSSKEEESPYGRIRKRDASKRASVDRNCSIGAIAEESGIGDDGVGACGEKSVSVPDISCSFNEPSFLRKPARRIRKNHAQVHAMGADQSGAEGLGERGDVQPGAGVTLSMPAPPPPPIRKDSIASSASADVGSTAGMELRDSEPSSPFRFRRAGLPQWSSMKKAMKFLNGVAGERTSVGQIIVPPADQSADAKLSIFYNQPVSSPEETSPIDMSRCDFAVDHTLQHSGLLYQLSQGTVGVVTGTSWGSAQVRWFNLCRGKLTWWRERGGAGPSSCLPLEQLASIRIAQDRPNPSSEGEVLSCFELGVIGGKSNWMGRSAGGGSLPSHSLLLGSISSTERRQWMQKLLESVVPPSCFPNFAVLDFSRAGSAYIKEGISGNWCKGWMLLYQRVFFYCLSGSSSAKESNLQYARSIKVNKEDDGCGPSILLDLQGGHSIYLRPMATEGNTFWPNAGSSNKFLASKSAINGWKTALKTAALESGPGIAEQQLTLEKIPVIVDKCLNFVYTHGGMSEGIYRRSGSNSTVTRLLTEFQRNAWEVQLTRRDYTEYDVAAVLKRFFRDLPEPLLTPTLHDDFCKIAESEDKEEKVKLYRILLEKLPLVNHLTLRRLLSHLNYVHSQQERNLMPVENLAAIWGPTLMHVEGNDSLGWSRRESEVVLDLVSLFYSLFDISPEEEAREKKMREVLERHFVAASISPAASVGEESTATPRVTCRDSESKKAFPGGWMPPSGDLKVWIHIFPPDSSANSDKGTSCVHVTVTPQKLSGQLVLDLCEQLGLKGKGETWGLEERVMGGALVRPLHPMEGVLDAVLRWASWDDADRKDNLLALAPKTLLSEAAHLARTKPPTIVNGELRFADLRSKSFKTYMFEFSHAKLSCYKDKRGAVKLAEWKVEDILWYLGHEPKRNPQSRWCITFIDKSKKPSRSKEKPFFGNTIAGTSSSEMLYWVTAMLLSEHPEGLSFPLTPDLLV
ncbi:uncharacterized protein LOC124159260 [Ischnura elegans]|uniref:uncharacterized protein LOC124159260 n=1 Tax=Ischnura elegans TaxID=197161 RepID=UPI001ED87CA9|nr:uncharacterized protein LOC124159260 [Ischnura elegans]